MRHILFIGLLIVLSACGPMSSSSGGSITEADLEQFFREHKVGRAPAAALKKRSLGEVSYLATIHGYADNLQVCQQLIEPYNKDASLSAIPGGYYCEELR